MEAREAVARAVREANRAAEVIAGDPCAVEEGAAANRKPRHQ